MVKRKIIEIERDLCNGCGLCTTACAEGALGLDGENKAILLKEIYCDGMGACLDVCPTGALKIVERGSEGYDAEAAYEHVLKTRGKGAASHVHGIRENQGHAPAKNRKRVPFFSACQPSSACQVPAQTEEEDKESSISHASELSQWPIQLHLVSPYAPYFKNADLLIAADCTAFSLGSFHAELLKSKKLIIACPKLDDTEGYIEKLSEIIKQNHLKSLTVAIMTVPCCSGLYRIAQKALELSGSKLSLKRRVIGLDGKLASL